MSIVFDRAVSFYDQTRALPPEIADKPIEALIHETGLMPGARVLELGIGTGRIALPLATRIGRVTGVDLSLLMMEVLQPKVVTGQFVDLAQADVLRLPFPADCFDASYAVHVFHLVSQWRDGVAEARRVLKPGGYLLVSWHRRLPDSPNRLIREELHRLVEPYGVSTRRPGAQSEEEILEALSIFGEPTRIVDVMDWTEPTTPGETLEEIGKQIHSETWAIPRAVMNEVMPTLRAWTREHVGPLDQPVEEPGNFRWLIAQKRVS